jgi:transcriptional regulator with XRE-family HTH domain
MTEGQVELGSRLKTRRQERGLTLAGLSAELARAGVDEGISQQHLSAIERGTTWPSAKLVSALDELLDTRGELLYLLRNAKVPRERETGAHILVEAHLFYPLFVSDSPTPAVQHEATKYDFLPRLGFTPCGDGITAVHSFPFNVVLVHEAHWGSFETLADLGVWRDSQISRCPHAAVERLAEIRTNATSRDHEPYCFTCFVVRDLPWQRDHRRRSLEILAVPAVLATAGEIASDDRADDLLHSHDSLGDVIDFSFAGNHVGFASWSAVAMHPDSPTSEIRDALVEFEIQLQAFWCYASNVEHSGGYAASEFGETFLRNVLRKLQRPWPTEHSTVHRLREALVVTSRITDLVESALSSAAARSPGRKRQ